MRERNPRHIALGIIGLLGVLLYVLACCRPAWSPDSSRLLFGYCNPETGESGVALYDRNTGAVRSVFSRQLAGDDCSTGTPTAAWSDDGSRAIIVWGKVREKKRRNPATGKTKTLDYVLPEVDVLPVEGAGKGLHVKLRHFKATFLFLIAPLAVSEGKLYFSGQDKRKLLQLDLKSGKRKFRTLEDDRVYLLYSHDGHIIYARGFSEDSDDIEFGELDTKELSLDSWFVLKKKSLKAQGVSDSTGFIAFEPHGDRLAILAQGADEKARILICNRRGLEQILKPELPNPASLLGNLQWSRDGKTFYATVVTPTEKNGITQLSLGEIPLAGGPVRLTPIVHADLTYIEDDGKLLFQISISPDGSTIAASTADFEKGDIDPANRGLFLVDLRDPARRVTRIQYPHVTGKNRTAGE